MATVDPMDVVRNAGLYDTIFAPQVIDENNNMSAGYTPSFNAQGYLIDPRAGTAANSSPAGTPYYKKGPNGNAFLLDKSGNWVDSGQKFNDVDTGSGGLGGLLKLGAEFALKSAAGAGMAAGLGGLAGMAGGASGAQLPMDYGIDFGGIESSQLPMDYGIDFGGIEGAAGSGSAGAAGSGAAAGTGAAGGAGGAGLGTAAAGSAAGLGSKLGDAAIKTGVNLLGTALISSLFGEDSAAPSSSAGDISNDQYSWYLKNYRPVEEQLSKLAMESNTPEYRARLQGAANADVTGAYNQASKEAASRLQSFGLNPSSPAYQSAMGSLDLSKAATASGARTQAGNLAEDRAYARLFDVANLGRNIPSQAAAGANAAAATNANIGQVNFAQNQSNLRNAGAAISPLLKYGTEQAQNWWSNRNPMASAPNIWGLDYATDPDGYPGWAKGGKVKHGLEMMTPHMKRGGKVKHMMPGMPMMAMGGMMDEEMMDEGRMGATIDNETGEVIGPGTGTSDSVPAVIDGQQPARISSGEFVMPEASVQLSGEEILEAIRKAGLEKSGLEPREDMAEEMPMDQMPMMKDGGMMMPGMKAMMHKKMPMMRRGGKVYRKGGRVCMGLGD